MQVLTTAPLPLPIGKHSDGLRELLDLAVAATTARVSDALREAAQARAVSERADRESLQVMIATVGPLLASLDRLAACTQHLEL
jgi:hypothetical protein